MNQVFTKRELERASKIALRGLVLPSGARLVALRNLNTGFKPLVGKDKAIIKKLRRVNNVSQDRRG